MWLMTSARVGAGLALAVYAGSVTAAHADSIRATIAAQSVQGAMVLDKNQSDASGADGKYDFGDSAALQVVLEAPAASSDAAEVQNIGSQFQVDVTSLQNRGLNDPHALSNGARTQQTKAAPAWDFQVARVVPEPASALLMGIGIAALVMFRQRGRTADKDSV